jgi:hypothetical protein
MWDVLRKISTVIERQKVSGTWENKYALKHGYNRLEENKALIFSHKIEFCQNLIQFIGK